jgi:hypothetical protein
MIKILVINLKRRYMRRSKMPLDYFLNKWRILKNLDVDVKHAELY